MYCPQCAAQNIDGAKFCRACGSDLEIITLALTNPAALRTKPTETTPAKPKDRLEKKIEGVHNTILGVCLLSASLLIGVALAIFLARDVPWILIWMVFFGWMAVWGAFALAGGLGALVESRMRLGQQEPAVIAAPDTAELLPAAREMPTIANRPVTDETSPQVSVTERTTDLLGKSPRRLE